ncbi:PRP38 family-domain-containing protein [Fomes fomentarius]|nr:PRP38 family-domain-containing protein [Fomes fomentarius]
MANTTVRGAVAIHGQNPQYLVESVIRNRIYDSNFWKEHCFALTAETLIDKATELKAIGGVYGNQKPTEFLSLLLKLLQIQPEKEILLEYIQADEFKYLRALAVFYIRMTFRAVEVYELLEPLLKDYRKLRYHGMGGYSLIHMDEFVDQLLNEERVCDLILPRLTRRDIGPRKSRLLDAMEGKSEHGSEKSRSRSRSTDRSRSRSPHRSRSGSLASGRSASQGRSRGSKSPHSPSPTGSRYISRSRSGSRSPYRSRSRSISPDRANGGSPKRFCSRSRSISPDRMDTT